MTIADFENISLTVGLTALVAYMMFIIYDLGKKSKAGKYGYFVLFLALGLGMVGFIAKSVIMHFMKI